MIITQLSVFVENKPGRLSEITDTFARDNIDIRALSIADTTNFGILRLIVDNPEAAEHSLKEAGFTVSLTNVIAISVADSPGGLSKALKVLTGAEIAVEYMYAFISRQGGVAHVILRVSDNQAAINALEAAGVKMLAAKDVYNN